MEQEKPIPSVSLRTLKTYSSICSYDQTTRTIQIYQNLNTSMDFFVGFVAHMSLFLGRTDGAYKIPLLVS